MSSGSIKNRIQQNNTELNNVITTVETLPDYVDTSDANATASDILLNKTAYVNDNLVTGMMPNNRSFKYYSFYFISIYSSRLY